MPHRSSDPPRFPLPARAGRGSVAVTNGGAASRRLRPERLLTLLVVAAAAALAASWVATVARDPRPSPVYSLAEVHHGLAHEPRAWIGRVVLVRATVLACLVPMDGPGSPCLQGHLVLAPAVASDIGAALPLVEGSRRSPLALLLRRVPWVARLVPGSEVRWGVVSLYRVQLRAAACGLNTSAPCYAAALLDSTLGSS